MFFTGITTLLTLYIVASVIGILSNQKRTYSKDLDNFIIKSPPIGRIIIIIGTVILIVIALLAYINRTPDNGAEDAAIIFVMLASACAIASLALDKQITVDGNSIKLKQLLPPKFQSYTFSDITHYAYVGDSIQVFSGQKKLFSVDRDLLGYENFVKRLERDGFLNSDDGVSVKVINKRDVIRKNGTITAMFFFMMFIGLIMGVISARNPVPGETSLGNFIICLFVGIGLFLFVVVPFMIIPSFINLRKLEKGLNIDFDEEMKKEGIGSFNTMTKNWFLNSNGGVFTAIRRDYVQSLISCDVSGNNAFYINKIRTTDGKTIKVRANSEHEFVDWLNWRFN